VPRTIAVTSNNGSYLQQRRDMLPRRGVLLSAVREQAAGAARILG
jgi:hypothetical protein